MAGLSVAALSGAAVNVAAGSATAGTGRSSKAQNVSKTSGYKLQRIVNKFKSGKKLTSGELSYLAAHAPDIYQKVLRIMQRREQLEKRLEQAKSKEEVQMIMMQEMQSVEKFCADSDDDFEKTALVNQMMDAYSTMVKSPEYRAKPDSAYAEEMMMEELFGAEDPGSVGEEEEEAKTVQSSGMLKTSGATQSAGTAKTSGATQSAGTAKTSGVTQSAGTSKTSGATQSAKAAKSTGEGETGSVQSVTYTARGTTTSVSASSRKKGRKVDVAI